MFISLKQKNIILITFLTSFNSIAEEILNKENENIYHLLNKEILVEKKVSQVSWINDFNLSVKYNKNYNDIYDNGEDDYTSINFTIKNKIFDSGIYNALFNSDVIKNIKIHNLNKNKHQLINSIYINILEFQNNLLIIEKKENLKEELLEEKNILTKNIKLNLNTDISLNNIDLKLLDIEYIIQNLKDANMGILQFLNNNSLINENKIDNSVDYIINIIDKNLNHISLKDTFDNQGYINDIKLKKAMINVEKYKQFGSLEFLYSYSYQKDPYQFRIITKDEDFKHNHNIELKYNIPLYSIRSNKNSELLRVQKLRIQSEKSFHKLKFNNNKNTFDIRLLSFDKKIKIITNGIELLEKNYIVKKNDYKNNMISLTNLNVEKHKFENKILDLKVEKNNKYIYILNYLKPFNISY